MELTRDRAETIAIQALGWLAGNEDLLPVFMGASGASADDLRERATDAEFQISVLDFLLMDDAWVVGFCDSANLPYDAPYSARQCLPGGGDVHWT